MFEIIIIIFLIFVNAFFVAVEFAIIRVRNSELVVYLEKHKSREKFVRTIKDNLDIYISAAQLGITLANLLLGWVGDEFFAKLFSPIFLYFGFDSSTSGSLSIIIGILFITYITVIFGEQTPKSIAIRYPKQFTTWLSIPMVAFYRIFKPFIWIINASSNGILKLLGIKPVKKDEVMHTEDEIRFLISEGQKKGVIDSTEHQLIEKIFDFNDKTAKDIMIPRNNMIALNLDDGRDKIIKTAIEEGYSRIPVFKETIDNIIGILYSKDLISATEHRELILISEILRPVYFIPENKHIGEILKEFQKMHIHLGIVVNEHGGVEGLVTLEDIIEEIVGEIEDEYDVETRKVQKDKLGIYLVDPVVSIEEINNSININLPVNHDEYQTLSGFLLTITGHIPEIYERIEYENLIFTVMEKTGNRLLKVKVQKF